MADMKTSWPPAGVSEVDLAFLKQLPSDLGETSDPKLIQERIEEALRTRADVQEGDPEAYKQALRSLAGKHPAMQGSVDQYEKNNYFRKESDHPDRHFLWLKEAPSQTYWRIYLTPAASTAPGLMASLYARLSAKTNILPNVGMKLSTYDAVRRLRDGLVIYTNHAGKDSALAAIADEAAEHPSYFSKQLVRFTCPVANGAAGLAPDPQSQAKDWQTQAFSWDDTHKDWIAQQNLELKSDPGGRGGPTYYLLGYMSYTQLVAAALTTCYLLARASQGSTRQVTTRKVAMKSRTGGPSQLAADAVQAAYREDRAAAEYRENVASAFSQLGINPSIPALAKPTVEGVGWLRYQFFQPKV